MSFWLIRLKNPSNLLKNHTDQTIGVIAIRRLLPNCAECGKEEGGEHEVQFAMGSTGLICDDCIKKFKLVPNPVWGGYSYVPTDWCDGCKYIPDFKRGDCFYHGTKAKFCGCE